MGITIFSLQGLLAPLQRLVNWLARTSAAHTVVRPLPIKPGTSRSSSSWTTLPGSCHKKPRRPLRVVRVAEAGPAPVVAGRMVISGRMADVCAELDRLAALETAAG
jgi:hypothetical protein